MAVKKKSAKPPRQSPGKVTNTTPVTYLESRGVPEGKPSAKYLRIRNNEARAELESDDNYRLMSVKDRMPKAMNPAPFDNRYTSDRSRETTLRERAKVEAPKGDPRRTTPSDAAGYISPYRRRQMRKP